MSSKFPHFELYYTTWAKSFTKSADPIVLFYHWCLIQHGFECLINEKETSLLPENWNTISKESYQIFYSKRQVKFRLEIFLIGEILHIEIKRYSDFTDTSQLIKISDFVNLDQDYKSQPYQEVFKNLNRLKERIDWAIYNINPAKLKVEKVASKPKATLDIINQIKLNRNELTKTTSSAVVNERRDSANSIISIQSTSSSTNSNVQPCSTKNKRMKKSTVKKGDKKLVENDNESTSSSKSKGFVIENNIAVDPLNTITATTTNEANLITATATTSLNQPKSSLTRADLFVDNPITNFIGYNKNVDEAKSVDEKILNENDKIKELFEKNRLKKCKIQLSDCFKIGILSSQSPPIILTDRIKNALSVASNETVNNTNKNIKKIKTELKPKRNMRGTRRLLTNESDTVSRSLAESDTESMASSDTNIIPIRNKRKRTAISSESSVSCETISSSSNSTSGEKATTSKDLLNEIVEANDSLNKNEATSLSTTSTKCKSKKISEYFHLNEKEHTKETDSDIKQQSTKSVENTSNTSLVELTHSGGKENAMIDLNNSELDSHPAKKYKIFTDCTSSITGDVKQPLKANNSEPMTSSNRILTNISQTMSSSFCVEQPTTTINTTTVCLNTTMPSMTQETTLNTTTSLSTSPKKPGFITNFLKRFPVKLPESSIAKQFEEAASSLRPLSFSFVNLNNDTSSSIIPNDKLIENIPTTFVSLNGSTSDDSDCTIVDEKPGLVSNINQNDDLNSRTNVTNIKLEKQ